MKQGFRQFNIFLILKLSIALSQESNGNGSAFTESPLSESRSSNSASNENRLPDLLREAKILLSDAFISDVMNDTLEVVYNFSSHVGAKNFVQVPLLAYGKDPFPYPVFDDPALRPLQAYSNVHADFPY